MVQSPKNDELSAAKEGEDGSKILILSTSSHLNDCDPVYIETLAYL